MKHYIQFSGKQFERMLWIIKSELKLSCFIKDISDEVTVFDGRKIWEKVYSLPTSNKNVRLIIFSSVDRTTGKVRSKGSDAVRFVLESKNDKGERFYKHVKKHLRIDTLQENMKATISYVMNHYNGKTKDTKVG